jgi:perosamine synthetase
LIPLLKAQLTGKEREYINKCLDNDWLTYRSPIFEEFETKFSEYIGKDSLFVTSGTAALHLALLALNIKHGDEVILPAVSFGTTASVVLAVGATPVYADTDHNGCITKHSVSEKITSRTKAVIVVHLYGEISEDVTGFGIPVIEDACEALGNINTKAAFTCFSFYANKEMTTGEGGMLVGDIGLAKKYRDGGFDRNYFFQVPGLNYRPTAFQAALGLAQLEGLNQVKAGKWESCKTYREYLTGSGVWLFVAKVKDPHVMQQRLSALGVETRRVFPLLPYQRPFQNGQRYFPNADEFYARGLCLPTGLHVNGQEKRIAEYVNNELLRTPDRSRELA